MEEKSRLESEVDETFPFKASEMKKLFQSYQKSCQENETLNYKLNELLKAQDKNLRSISNLERQIKDVKDSISFKIGFGFTYIFRLFFDFLTGRKPFNQTYLWWIIKHFTNPSAIFGNKHKRSLLKKRWLKERTETQETIKSYENVINTHSFQRFSFSRNEEVNPSEKKDNYLLGLDLTDGYTHKKSRILYVSPKLPEYDRSSGGRRATRLLSILAEEFDVFVFTLGTKPQKYVEILEGLGIHIIRSNVHSDVKHEIPDISTIIFAWHETYYTSQYFLKLYPDAKIIIDSVDVHWIRANRSSKKYGNLTAEAVEKIKKRELQVYKEADLVWAVTETDKNAILRELPECDVRIVSNVHEALVANYEPSNERSILFFGGFNHDPNISAAKLLANEIFPVVRESIPDIILYIAGSNAPKEIEDLGKYPGIKFLGFVKENELYDLYKKVTVVTVPLLVGSGIKGKICESIAYMTPVITNEIGNEGINLVHERDALIGDNATFPSLIIDAFSGKYDLEAIAKNAQAHLLPMVDKYVAKDQMIRSIIPNVSICIVTWNKLNLIKRCIESILLNTIYSNYKIIVYSNGCTDGTQQYLEQLSKKNQKIYPILAEENNVFVLPNNKMMQESKGDDVVLVNNDVCVTSGWLSSLQRTAYMSDDIGIVGSKILYPNGQLQEFGSELYSSGAGRNIGKYEDPEKPQYNIITEVGYVSGCSMYIKRKTINKIGLFDEQFHPCYYEDSDYCYSAKENGLKTVVTPYSVVYHDEGGTAGTDIESGMKKYQALNRSKFVMKHRGKNNGIIWE